MTVLIVDVAAENGGALTIFDQFRKEFEEDQNNRYVCLLSKPEYQNCRNVTYKNYKWVKKSFIHRLYFDNFYIKKVISEVKPDRILSLQNNSVNSGGIEQEVYFHNALLFSEKRYSIRESKELWIYQTIIARIVRRSLKRASKIYVQAEWIKHAINKSWNIEEERIVVKPPYPELKLSELNGYRRNKDVFYPANYALYKNYDTLLKACLSVWKQRGTECGLKLHLLGLEADFRSAYGEYFGNEEYPIYFHGRLTKREMFEMYQTTSLVFPSFVETVGLPLMESASVGSYVMAADLEYAHEALSGYNHCAYFNPKDEGSLEKLLLELVDGGN